MSRGWHCMSSEGIIRSARRLTIAFLSAFIVSAVFAQTPPRKSDDLDVTMRVIVDPDAKVPDEIVRRIPLPKPPQPSNAPAQDSGKSDDKGKPAESGAKGKPDTAGPPGQGRAFGQEVAEEARKHAEDA